MPIRFHHAVLQRLQVAPDVGKRGTQFVGHIGHHVAAQLFQPDQPVGHGIKGPGQLTYFVLGRDFYALAQVPGLHSPHSRSQGLHRGEDAA